MTNKILFIFLFIFISGNIIYSQNEKTDRHWFTSFDEVNRLSFPEWAYEVVKKDSINMHYNLSFSKNPFLLNGDFNNGGELDVAAFIKNRGTGLEGLVIVHRDTNKAYIFAARHDDGMTDTTPFTHWYVYSDKYAEPGIGESESITLLGDAIKLVKLDSSSGIVYWNGKEYKWYQ